MFQPVGKSVVTSKNTEKLEVFLQPATPTKGLIRRLGLELRQAHESCVGRDDFTNKYPTYKNTLQNIGLLYFHQILMLNMSTPTPSYTASGGQSIKFGLVLKLGGWRDNIDDAILNFIELFVIWEGGEDRTVFSTFQWPGLTRFVFSHLNPTRLVKTGYIRPR